MVAFNPAPQEKQDPNWMRNSWGTSNARPNTALGDLFSGVAKVGDGVINAVDQNNINNIKKDVYGAVDEVRDMHGVGAVIDAENTPAGGDPETTGSVNKGDGSTNTPSLIPSDDQGDKATPAGLSAAGKRLQGITQQMAEGKLTDLSYYAKLATVAKGLRVQYPGYRDEIDSMISKVTGINPANAVRTELQNVMDQAIKKRATAADADEKFIRNHGNMISPEERANLSTPEQLIVINKRMRQGQTIKDTVQDVELASKAGRLNQDNAYTYANTLVGHITQQAFTMGLSSIGLGDLQTKMDAIRNSGKPPTPQEQQFLTDSFGKLQSTLTNKIMTELTRNVPDKDGKMTNLQGMIGDPNKVKDLIATAMIPLTAMKEALFNGDYGTVGALTRQLKAEEDETLQRYYEGNPIGLVLGVISKKIGPEAAGLLLEKGKNLSKLDQGVTDFANGILYNDGSFTYGNTTKDGKTQPKTIGEGFTKVLTDPQAKQSPSAVNAYLNAASRVITAKEATPDMKVAAAAKIYNKDLPENVLRVFKMQGNDNSKVQVYSKFFNDATTKSMLALKESNPEAWNNYVETAKQSFSSLWKQEMDTVATAGDRTGQFTIDWNPEAKKFQLNVTKDGQAATSGFFRRSAQEQYQPLLRQIENFNMGLGGLKGIAEAEGHDVGEVAAEFLKDRAMNEPKPGMFKMMYEGVKSFLKTDNPGKLQDGSSAVGKGGEEKGNPKEPGKQSSLDDSMHLYSDDELKQLASYNPDEGGFSTDIDWSTEPGRQWGPERVAQLPAGMRNNNPGNIKYHKGFGVIGPSSNTDQGDPQAVYSNPYDGMTAAVKLANAKFRGGKTTVDDLIAGQRGWTPGNHQAAANVARSMGVDPTAEVDLNNKTQMAKFMRGLVVQEHGQAGRMYSDNLIRAAVARVLGRSEPIQEAQAKDDSISLN